MGTKTQKQQIGQIGEDIACKFLVKHGYKIIQRNYLKVFGEIDIICGKNGIIHFIEVKSVSRKTICDFSDEYRPEDNIHANKLKRIGRTIQTYIFENNLEQEWKFDIVTVHLDHANKVASVNTMFDVIL